MKTRIFLPLAGVVLLAVTGCSTSVNTIENAQKEGQRQMVSDQRVITDTSLAKKVSFVGVNQAMTPGGLLKVQIELLNRKRSLQRFSYQFQWFDANGMQINNVASPTIPDQIEGGESKFISSRGAHAGLQRFSRQVHRKLITLQPKYPMKKTVLLSLLAAAIPFVVGGCATQAHYIQTGGHESLVTVNSINIQDFIQAANAATSDLLASGALDKVANPPAVLAISRIVNNTGQQIDTDLLTKKIRVALLNSGKAQTTTTMGLGGTAEDPMAKGLQQENEFMNDQKATRKPDFTLSGKIIQTIAKDGNTSQSTFSFQLSLTDAKTGLAVWEGEKEITKQGAPPVRRLLMAI